jgi:hypothetical protein
MKWAGWGLSGLVMAFLAMDTAMKLADIAPVRQAAGQIGWPLALDRPLGVIDLAGLVLYAIPRTSALGAVYLTGLLGGAVAAHLRLGSVTPTGPDSATIVGDLTVHGVTKPVTLVAKFHGGGANPMSHKTNIGFDATGAFNRADFGVKTYVPMISDQVDIRISAAFEKN